MPDSDSNDIAAETAQLLADTARELEFPRVERVVLPSREADSGKDAEFAMVVLEDGSAGCFYLWLDDTLGELDGIDLTKLGGLSALRLLDDVCHPLMARRALALGAINALSQHVFRRAALPLDSTGSMGGMKFDASDHVGMVGLFPSLARRLHDNGTDFVVVEKKRAHAEAGHDFPVTLDPSRLERCNKVLITGSTLLNESLAAMLSHCRNAERVVLIGPTASCIPDRLFAHGVHCVGGSVIVDWAALNARRARDEPWGDAVRKYLINARDYPGLRALLARM